MVLTFLSWGTILSCIGFIAAEVIAEELNLKEVKRFFAVLTITLLFGFGLSALIVQKEVNTEKQYNNGICAECGNYWKLEHIYNQGLFDSYIYVDKEGHSMESNGRYYS